MTAAAALISLALSGCSVIITTGIFSEVSSSHGVQIVAAVSSHGASVDTVTARITNTGARGAFIPRCGSAPLLQTQQFSSGTWIDAADATCPAGGALNPIELDPGATIVAVKLFSASGRFRLVTTVGESDDFSQSARSTSNPFAIP